MPTGIIETIAVILVVVALILAIRYAFKRLGISSELLEILTLVIVAVVLFWLSGRVKL